MFYYAQVKKLVNLCSLKKPKTKGENAYLTVILCTYKTDTNSRLDPRFIFSQAHDRNNQITFEIISEDIFPCKINPQNIRDVETDHPIYDKNTRITFDLRNKDIFPCKINPQDILVVETDTSYIPNYDHIPAKLEVLPCQHKLSFFFANKRLFQHYRDFIDRVSN